MSPLASTFTVLGEPEAIAVGNEPLLPREFQTDCYCLELRHAGAVRGGLTYRSCFAKNSSALRVFGSCSPSDERPWARRNLTASA